MRTHDPFQPLADALRARDASPLLVGLSGGLDSTVLLHALARDPQRLRDGLRAVHVDHGLHADAAAWSAHCETFCRTLDVELQVLRVQVRVAGEGLEAAARRARYDAFAQALAPGEVLATAHHRQDQAETFLLRALRGSGPDGLAAMRPWRAFAGGHQWRPLLSIDRAVLLEYAQAHGLSWIEDPANAEPRHDRNFLRQEVLPLLRRRWPQADGSLALGATLSADALELLEYDDALALAMAATLDPQALSVQALMALPALRRARVLRRWIDGLGLPPLPGQGVARIESDLLPARADAQARFAWRDVVVERWRDLLHVRRQRAPLPHDWRAQWDGGSALPLPGGDVLRLEGTAALPAPLQARPRAGGERLLLPGRAHSQSLKNLLQGLGVPPWEREALPLLFDAEGALVAVADLAYADGLDRWLRARGARLRWTRASGLAALT